VENGCRADALQTSSARDHAARWRLDGIQLRMAGKAAAAGGHAIERHPIHRIQVSRRSIVVETKARS
jgi:hypothetical protein